MLAERRTDICPTEICKTAAISRTTFYAHYNHRDVIKQYENRLMAKFLREISATAEDKEIIFVRLLRFVRDEREYFTATMPNANYWLLNAIFENLHPVLRTKDCSAKTYESYAMQQITLVSCWVKYDNCAPDKLLSLAQKMARMPMMRVD